MSCRWWVPLSAPGGYTNHEVVRNVADKDSWHFFESLCPGDVFFEYGVVDSSVDSPIDDIFDHISVAALECNDIKLLLPNHN